VRARVAARRGACVRAGGGAERQWRLGATGARERGRGVAWAREADHGQGRRWGAGPAGLSRGREQGAAGVALGREKGRREGRREEKKRREGKWKKKKKRREEREGKEERGREIRAGQG